jgi:hypothetical protein
MSGGVEQCQKKKKGKETTQQKNKKQKKRYKTPEKPTPKKKLENDFMEVGYKRSTTKKSSNSRVIPYPCLPIPTASSQNTPSRTQIDRYYRIFMSLQHTLHNRSS